MVFVLPGAIGLSKYVNIMDTSKEAQHAEKAKGDLAENYT